MFTNICTGDMGKYNSNIDTAIYSHQDSDKSFPLCLALCKFILPFIFLSKVNYPKKIFFQMLKCKILYEVLVKRY